jgi:hypothetical protein
MGKPILEIQLGCLKLGDGFGDFGELGDFRELGDFKELGGLRELSDLRERSDWVNLETRELID